eukprot:1148793-Prorocentrum_lima.AAC.1
MDLTNKPGVRAATDEPGERQVARKYTPRDSPRVDVKELTAHWESQQKNEAQSSAPDPSTDAIGAVPGDQTLPSSPPPPIPTTSKPNAESPSETFSSLSSSSRSALMRQPLANTK